MAENTINTSPTNTSGGNSMMLIIGAVVLAAILGYVIFSSANQDTDTIVNDAMMEESSTIDSPEDGTMMEDQIQGIPDAGTMELRFDETGTQMDTGTTNPNVKTIQIEAGSFYYRPNTITVSAGDTVRLVMNSVDMMHDFNIDELGVSIPVTQSGQSNSVEFTVTEAGTYEFYCSVNQHRQQGQIGTLIVQ